MKTISETPCVFGFVASDRPDMSYRPSAGVTVHFRAAGEALFSTKGLGELRVRADAEGVVALLGRIYSPSSLRAVEPGDFPDLSEVVATKPAEIQGSYVLFRRFVGPDGRGSWELRTDKYGFRGLFYWEREDGTFFSTHLAGLKALPCGSLPGYEPDALLHYYNFGTTSNEQTLLKGIRKLPPAAILRVDSSGQVAGMSRYFDLLDLHEPDVFSGMGEEQVCRELDTRMEEAVRLRAPRRSHVGIALSGGVDSGYLAVKLVASGVRVPGQADHRFRHMPSTDSRGCRPPVTISCRPLLTRSSESVDAMPGMPGRHGLESC